MARHDEDVNREAPVSGVCRFCGEPATAFWDDAVEICPTCSRTKLVQLFADALDGGDLGAVMDLLKSLVRSFRRGCVARWRRERRGYEHWERG